MLQLDLILFNAITSDSELMEIIGGRVKSTCFEVSPDEKDNTQLPYIVIRDLGKQPSQQTKDDGWMPSQWQVDAGIEIGAESPNEVDVIAMKVMKAVDNHIRALAGQGSDIPYLQNGFPQTKGIEWDWTKPCYWDVVSYQCDIDYHDNEAESNSDI
jgi:hypothetical protein